LFVFGVGAGLRAELRAEPRRTLCSEVASLARYTKMRLLEQAQQAHFCVSGSVLCGYYITKNLSGIGD